MKTFQQWCDEQHRDPGEYMDHEAVYNAGVLEGLRLAKAALQDVKVSETLSERYGCHCDLEPGMAPDGCVIDEGRPQDCIYAKPGMKKEQCKYWKAMPVDTGSSKKR